MTFAGGVMVGAVVSLTVNVVVTVAVLPAPLLLLEPSLAVSVMVCEPRPTTVPGAGSCVTLSVERLAQTSEVSSPPQAQLSETFAVAVKSGTTAWQLPSAEAVCGAVTMTGGVTSLTVTVCAHEALPVRCVSSLSVGLTSGLLYGPGASCE